MNRAYEKVAVAGAILSLLFVGFEIRQNTQAARAANHFEVIGLAYNFTEWVMTDDKVAEVFGAIISGETFEDDQLASLRKETLTRELFNLWELSFYAHQNGQLELQFFEGVEAFFSTEVLPSNRDYWQANSHIFGEDFRDHVTDQEVGTGG
jgi:hypothetical protein